MIALSDAPSHSILKFAWWEQKIFIYANRPFSIWFAYYLISENVQ